MIIFIILSLCFIIPLWFAVVKDSDTGCLVAVVSGAALAIGLILLPVVYYGIKGEIQEYRAVELTIKKAREKGLDLESAAFQMKIANCNCWLASRQYWNGTLFDIFVPDDVMELKALE